MTAATAPALPAAKSKSQLAYDWLRDGITSGRMTPGYRIVLQTVADELGVSVVPVREATRRLQAEGLVTFERNVGARVAMIDLVEYEYTMQTLGVVEGVATALAAPLLTTGDLARARTINDRMAALLADLDPHLFTELNRQFHTVLFDPCPNPHIRELVDLGWVRMSRLRDSTFAFIPGRARDSVAEHAHLLDLILAGAPALEIELATRHHLWATLAAFQSGARAGARFTKETA